MIKAGELFMNAIDHWRDAKGIGTALIPAPFNDKLMVLGILQRVYTRSPTCKTIIITEDFNNRRNIIDFLTQQENNEENNKEFTRLIDGGYIKIFTIDFIQKKNINITPFVCIVYRLDRICSELKTLLINSKFKLIVLNKIISNQEEMAKVYKLAPILNDFKQAEVEQARLSTPVEEYQLPVTIEDSEDVKTLLNYYNEYVATSMAIFGSFDIMQQANSGNQTLNISSTQICNTIAHENGWNEHLDMDIEFNREIDKLYNPMSLKERASKTYEIIRNRNQLLSDYSKKLEVIFKIVEDNYNKKILIINKRGEFASDVTNYINLMSNKVICMNYHDKMDSIPAIDANGYPLLYKTGLNKGKQRIMGIKAQKTNAEKLFNNGNIRVLSTSNAPDKNLNIEVDIIIISSPFCENITSYIYRLANVQFRNNRVTLYSIYCQNTSEQKQLENRTYDGNHIIKKCYNEEDNIDFIVDD